MDKNTEIKFAGQPISNQVISIIDARSIKSFINKHNSVHNNRVFKLMRIFLHAFISCFSMRRFNTKSPGN